MSNRRRRRARGKRPNAQKNTRSNNVDVDEEYFRFQLQQHNILPEGQDVYLTECVVSNDGCFLYSLDGGDINLIHCIEMTSSGKLNYTQIRAETASTHSNTDTANQSTKKTKSKQKSKSGKDKSSSKTNKVAYMGHHLVYHDNGIWMYGCPPSRSKSRIPDLSVRSNELWKFDLITKQWQQKKVQFIEEEWKRIPEINDRLKKERNVDLPIPCARFGHIFRKISEQYAIISHGRIEVGPKEGEESSSGGHVYYLNDCYSLNMDTFECKYLFNSKAAPMQTLGERVLHQTVYKNYHDCTTRKTGNGGIEGGYLITHLNDKSWFSLDLHRLINKIENETKNSIIEIDYIPIWNGLCHESSDGSEYSFVFSHYKFKPKSKTKICSIGYYSSVKGIFSPNSCAYAIYDTNDFAYKHLTQAQQQQQARTRWTNQQPPPNAIKLKGKFKPKRIEFYTNDADFDENSVKKNNNDGDDDNNQDDSDESQDMKSVLKNDAPFNWKQYKFFCDKELEGSSLLLKETMYRAYAMKYGYIWDCTYYKEIFNGKKNAMWWCGSSKSKQCIFSLTMYHPLEWKIQRLLWIGHYKNTSDCLFNRFRKELIEEIINWLQMSIHEKLRSSPLREAHP